MPTDRSTHATAIAASTPPLTTPIDIALGHGLRIVIPPATQAPPYAHVTYLVDAVGWNQSIRIAQQTVDSRSPAIDANDTSDFALNTSANAVRPLESVVGQANSTRETLTETLAGNLVWHALNASNDASCTIPNATVGLGREICYNMNGDVGRVGERLQPRCSGPEPRNADSLPNWLAWYAIRSFDDRQTYPTKTGPRGSQHPDQANNVSIPAPATEQKVCASQRDQLGLNDTAQENDVRMGDAPFPVIPDAPRSNGSGQLPDFSSNQNWRDVTLNVTAGTLPVRGGFVTIPAGFRLVLRINANASVGSQGETSAPIDFQFGRADAQTRMEFRTPTRAAFAQFAMDREAIGPGRHTGFFSNLTDADDYAVFAPAGHTLSVRALSGVRLTLWSPEGAVWPSSPTAPLNESGSWTVRAMSSSSTPPTAEYAFEVTIATPTEPETDGGHVEEGSFHGTLNVGDVEDVFTFHAWKAQRFTVLLDAPAGVKVEAIKSGAAQGEIWDANTTPQSISARASNTGLLAVRVSRGYEVATYTLTLDLDERGNLSQVPMLIPLPHTQNLSLSSDIAGYQGGVDVFGDFGGGLFHITPEGAVLDVNESSRYLAAPSRTADGALAYANANSGIPAMSVNGVPLSRHFGQTFGADGALYAIREVGGPNIVRILPDRTVTAYTLETWHYRVIAAPDGTIYLLDQTALGFDPASGAFEPAPEMAGLLAFDASGGWYRTVADTVVEWVDPMSHEATAVAQSLHPIFGLAATNDRLYARLGPYFGSAPILGGGIGVVTVDRPGFEGFHPTFEPLAAPDLVMTGFEDIILGVNTGANGTSPGEDHLLRVHMRNQGGSVAGTANVTITLECGLRCRSFRATAIAPALAPGETTILEFNWHATDSLGDQGFIVDIDSNGIFDTVVESDETNNRRTGKGHAYFQGNHALCEAALGVRAHGAPQPVNPTACVLTRL